MGNRQLERYKDVRKADNLDDQLNPTDIQNIESTSQSQEDLQTGVLSQLKRILFGDEAGKKWNHPVPESIESLAQKVNNPEIYDVAASELPFLQAGHFVYLKNDGKVYRASASNSNTMPAIGIVLKIESNQATLVDRMIISGFSGLITGNPYFISTAPGLIAPIPPSGSGQIIQSVGRAKSATELVLRLEEEVIRIP